MNFDVPTIVGLASLFSFGNSFRARSLADKGGT
jgi:hypothetical protein